MKKKYVIENINRNVIFPLDSISAYSNKEHRFITISAQTATDLYNQVLNGDLYVCNTSFPEHNCNFTNNKCRLVWRVQYTSYDR